MNRARGFIDLAFDVVEETMNLAERAHHKVVDRTARRFAPIEPAKTPARAAAGAYKMVSKRVYQTMRAVNGITRFTVDAAADIAQSHLAPGAGMELTTPVRSTEVLTASWYVDYLQATLNGLWGDYFAEHSHKLALDMTLRHHGRHLPITPEAFAAAFPNPTNKVCIFVHSLASTEWLWSLSSEEYYGDPDITFGTRLCDDLDFTPIYLRYNTGRHISENGKDLAGLLTEVMKAYPIPIEEVALVGHSMGGLVARSAAHYAREHEEPWVKHLKHVVCIGSPHLGAWLEKTVAAITGLLKKIEAAGAQIPAEIINTRSAGIKDLRYGYTVDEEWEDKDPDAVFENARKNVPLVDGVGYYFLAATMAPDENHPLGHLVGDLLVRPASASGDHKDPNRRIHFDSGTTVPGVNHIHIANHPAVYEAIRELLSPKKAGDSAIPPI